MLLYEEAIHSASENGFVQNEGLAHEVAARFYGGAPAPRRSPMPVCRTRGRCYLRWGAFGKVRNSSSFIRISATPSRCIATATIARPRATGCRTVLKAAQPYRARSNSGSSSGNTASIAVEHAGAESWPA